VVVEPGKPRAVDARAGTCQPDSDSARGESVPTYLPAYLPTYYVGRPPMLLPHHLHSVTHLLTHSSTHPSTHLSVHPPAVASCSRTHAPHPAHHHARRPCLCPPAPSSAAPSTLVFEKVWQKGCADMALCCPRSALGLHCSHAPMLCPALSPPSLEWLSLASTLASSSLYQRPVGQNIFAAA
jgi:hypothetical protein